jgi:hypothetical protein
VANDMAKSLGGLGIVSFLGCASDRGRAFFKQRTWQQEWRYLTRCSISSWYEMESIFCSAI